MALSLKSYALALLSRREYSRHELSVKLQRYAKRCNLCFSEIEQVLAWLQEHRFQSDSRFSASLVRRRLAQFGNRAIAAELAQHGLQWQQRKSDTGASAVLLSASNGFAQEPSNGLMGGLFDDEQNTTIASEEERALAWLRRRFGVRFQELDKMDVEERKSLEVKAKRALAGRGFEFEAVRKAWRVFLSETII